MPDMPKYQRPFNVWALKIADVLPPTDFTGAMLIPADPTYSPFPVAAGFVQEFRPKAGGYFVVYASGYQVFMPAADFEAAYSPVA